MFTVLALENDLPCRDIGRADVGREVDGVLLLKDLLRDLVGDCKLLLGVLGGDGLESCAPHDFICISRRPGKNDLLQLGHGENSPGAWSTSLSVG